jgi:hypothetical protein
VPAASDHDGDAPGKRDRDDLALLCIRLVADPGVH